MSCPSRSRTVAAGMILLNLVVRTLACSLNVPESVLQNTGSFVLAHVQAVESVLVEQTDRALDDLLSGQGAAGHAPMLLELSSMALLAWPFT